VDVKEHEEEEEEEEEEEFLKHNTKKAYKNPHTLQQEVRGRPGEKFTVHFEIVVLQQHPPPLLPKHPRRRSLQTTGFTSLRHITTPYEAMCNSCGVEARAPVCHIT
jgi:hypothetical protein